MSSKKYNSRRKNNRQNHKPNTVGLAALQKCRFFVYLNFFFLLVTMFHKAISGFFGISDTKVLYGMILMIAAQVIVASMHIVKFATTIEQFVEKDRQKEATMYTARARFFILMQAIVLILLTINHVQFTNLFLDVIICLIGVTFIIFTLQNLTILQRNFI